MTRAFIAVELPDQVDVALAGVVRELRLCCQAAGLRAGWSRPEGYHLTLKFLGSTPADRLRDVERALTETAARHRPFTCHLAGVGAFPSVNAPRTLWVGVADDEGRDALAALARAVEAAVEPIGFPREARPFSPHLTVARIALPRPLPGLADLAARYAGRLATVEVRRVALMKSEPRTGGSIYTAIGYCDLPAKRL